MHDRSNDTSDYVDISAANAERAAEIAADRASGGQRALKGNPNWRSNRWWDPKAPSEYFDQNHDEGRNRFLEIADMAPGDEHGAYQAIKYALTSTNWRGGGMGMEEGFAEEVARHVLSALNAHACGAAPEWDPNDFVSGPTGKVRIKELGILRQEFSYPATPEAMEDGVVLSRDEAYKAVNAAWAIEQFAKNIVRDYPDEDGPSCEAAGIGLLAGMLSEILDR